MQEELKLLSESVKGRTKPRYFPEVSEYWGADVRPIGRNDFIRNGARLTMEWAVCSGMLDLPSDSSWKLIVTHSRILWAW